MARVRLSPALLRAYLRRCKAADGRTRVALVLGAAGAPGAYAAGAVDALLAARVPVDLVVGASGGALNACLYLLGRVQGATPPAGLAGPLWGRLTLDQVAAPAALRRAWRRLRDLEGWRPPGVFLPSNLALLALAVAYIRNGAADPPLRETIRRELARLLGLAHSMGAAACGHALARRWQAAPAAPELIVPALELTQARDALFVMAGGRTVEALRARGWPVELLAGRDPELAERPDLLVPALLASAALLPVLPPVRIGDRVYVDGGYTNPLPLHLAVAAGATHVLVVESVPPQPRAWLPGTEVLHIAPRVGRALVAAQRARQLHDAGARRGQPRLYQLRPASSVLGALDFDGGPGLSLAQLAEQGRRDAELGLWWASGNLGAGRYTR